MTQCKDLAEVRRNIDDLDTQIVALLSKRAGFVHQAARFKPTKADVVVPSRIEEIVLRVRHLAREHGADPDLMEHIYRSMIDAYIVFEAKTWTGLHKSEEQSAGSD